MSRGKIRLVTSWPISLGVISLLAGAPSIAEATIISGSSSAYGESVSLSLTPPVGFTAYISSGPEPSGYGTAPPSYSYTSSLRSEAVDGLLSTGLLVVDASSNADGSPGSKSASADATVNRLAVTVLDALGINAETVESTAAVNGDFGALVASGTTTLTGISINGASAIDLTPTPNDVVLNSGGIKVTLNEQILSGNGITDADLIVNAVDIAFTDALVYVGELPEILNGNITIAHSEAGLTAAPSGIPVPEPSSLLLVAGGLVSVLGLRRRLYYN